jgi:hypothetical protein
MKIIFKMNLKMDNKLTVEELIKLLQCHPYVVPHDHMIDVFTFIGMKVKEYRGYPFRTEFEVHHQRTYLFKLTIDESNVVSLGNEYIKFPEGANGICTPCHTMLDLLRLALIMGQQMDYTYRGEVIYRDGSKYTPEELAAFAQVMNDTIFADQD